MVTPIPAVTWTSVELARDLKHPEHASHVMANCQQDYAADQFRVWCACGDMFTLDGEEVCAQRGRELADGPRLAPVLGPTLGPTLGPPPPRDPNVIREALSSLSPLVSGLEAVEAEMKKKLHERWAHQQALRPIEDRALAAPSPPVDRNAPKQWPIERYIQENEKLRARAAKAERDREAALSTAAAAREQLEKRSDAVAELGNAQRTIAVQKANIAALDDELKAARARPLEWKPDPAQPPPTKVRWGGFAPPVYGTVQLDAEALEASRGDKGAFVTAAQLEGATRERKDWLDGRSAVASAPGIAPKHRARPYPAVIDYARPIVAAAVVVGCQLDDDFLANAADVED